jgi:flagellar biosynthetic protein FliP
MKDYLLPFEALQQATESSAFDNLAPPLQIAVFLGAMALLTTLMVSVTSFTRIVIVLSFVRRAMTTQEIPPNASLIGLALFLTLFTMGPTLDAINNDAVKPYTSKEIEATVAISRGGRILHKYMSDQTRETDVAVFLEMAKVEAPGGPEGVPFRVLVPAYLISELKTAFIMGFCIYIPFVLVDLLVSTVLMSLGMMMMPPVVVSAPIKLLLFVLVDGWSLVTQGLNASFY